MSECISECIGTLAINDEVGNLDSNENARSGNNMTRKPLVPPKPHKKKNHEIIDDAENGVDVNATSVTETMVISGRPPLLQRKKPLYASQSTYDANSKVTLDNPAVLEQQLEVLAHHKKQLEKRGLLLQQQQQRKDGGVQKSPLPCVPKLSSTSLANSESDAIYANIRPIKGTKRQDSMPLETETTSIDTHSKVDAQRRYFENMITAESKPTPHVNPMSKIYSNILYEKSGADAVLPTPLSTLEYLCTKGSATAETSAGSDDDIPPPPSPVSSSYSELRRATDVFTAKKMSNSSYQQPLVLDAVEGRPQHITAAAPQIYMNMNYNAALAGYSPTLQSQVSQDSADYYGFGSFSQGSSTYESIYEPINPRPPSQLSARSNYFSYSPYINTPHSQLGDMSGSGTLSNSSSLKLSTLGSMGASQSSIALYSSGGGMSSASTGKEHMSGNHKSESEVEALTDFLVHSMDGGNDVDNYGLCFKCNERVLGENSGCTAMNQIYHIACFTCSQCQINLQGKPFYALEGKPYCEQDYLQTLEKCSVCMKPILERILRATGKPYHPQCFTCVICGKSLDGIPFTVDATNQNYCIEDFHKKFAPRCCVCKNPIMPEPGEEETVRVVALDRSFHFECYKCEDCGLLLSSEGLGCYPLDDHVLCKSCNAKRVQMLTNRITTEL